MAGKDQSGGAGKAPFVAQGDRPEVRLKAGTRLTDLTVRDLATILGQLGTGKDFWDGKDWQKDDFDGSNKPWKEFKDKEKEKEKEKEKDFKEKREIKELKLEKLENDGVFEAQQVSDPRLEQVIRAISGLSAKVEQLADQLEQLKKSKG